MGSEYIRLTSDEKSYSEKSLLSSQMNSLTSLQHMKKYHQLRKQEFTFKVQLKNKLSELYNELHLLDKLLPHSTLFQEKKPIQKDTEEELIISIHSSEKAKEDEIQEQLEEIRKKLKRLS